MNGEYLYEALGGIAPAYVDEAEKQPFAKPLWRKALPMAACLVLILGLAAGFPPLLHAGVTPSVPEAASPEPSLLPTEDLLRLSFWLNLGSLLLGLAAWGLPMIALFRRQHHKALTLASFVCCALSLLLQVCNVLHRVNAGDFTTLADTMWFALSAAVVLVIGTAVLNLSVYAKQWLRKK